MLDKYLTQETCLLGEKCEANKSLHLNSAKIPRLAVSREFVYRLFYPQIPIVLTARSGKSTAAMPAVSCMSVSNDPPLLAVAVDKSLKTNRVLKKATNFGVNWIDFRKRRIADSLSLPSKTNDKLKQAGIPYIDLLNAPILEDSMAYVICKKTQELNLGDHTLFVGEVIGAMASTDFDEYWKYSDYRPLLYRGSPFRAPYLTVARSG